MPQRPPLDWNDLAAFVAVAETGSTLAAGRALHVSQTTAARRIAALEAALALRLFDRRQAGYALTASGEALLPHAHAVAASVTQLSDAAAAQVRTEAGSVRFSTGEIYAVTVLAPILRDLHLAHPELRIELDTTDALRDLASGGADIALRSCDRPEGAGLVARRLADDHWAVYCSRDYAAAHGRPARRSELAGHPFVGGGEGGIWRMYRAWLEANGLEDAVAVRHGSATGMLSAVRAGVGLAVLPCFIAEHDPDLVRCLPPKPGSERGLWLLTHERLRHTPRVRVVLDFLAERLTPLGRLTF